MKVGTEKCLLSRLCPKLTVYLWIYEEYLFMDKIRRKEPSRFHHQNMICFSDGGRFIAESATENLRITHDLQCDFKPISGDDLFSLRSVTALDNLYEKKGIVSRSIIYGLLYSEISVLIIQ